jgi:hypothetical protein
MCEHNNEIFDKLGRMLPAPCCLLPLRMLHVACCCCMLPVRMLHVRMSL